MAQRQIHSAVVTGPTGAVGSALCQELLNRGIRVYAVVRCGSSRVANLPKHELLTVIACDITQLQTLPEKIASKVDAFFHLAWAHTIGAGRNDMPAQIQNIQYTIDAVCAAKELGCKVFLGAGSQAEYGRVEGILKPNTPCFPENGYGMAKLCAGQMSRVKCAMLGMDHIWVRILSVYGPKDGPLTMISGTIEKLLRGEKPALTEGIQEWDYLFSEDAAKAICCLAESGQNGGIYPLGSGTALPLREYILMLKDAIDPTLPLGFGEIPYGTGQVMFLKADISQLIQDTGYTPETSFQAGIEKTIEWMRHRDAE